MTDAVIAGADTDAVAKRKPVQLKDSGVGAELVAQLVERARSAGLRLTGEGGLLQQLAKWVLESALDGEITGHLGYDRAIRAGRTAGTPATVCAARRCSPRWARSSSPQRRWNSGPVRVRPRP